MVKSCRWLALIWTVVATGAAAAAEFYVDPVNGSMAGDGSAQDPWSTIGEVIEAGLVESQQWETLPWEEGVELVPRNPGAPVRAGDTLYLRSGYHGALFIQSHYNQDFITIAAEPGHTPLLQRVHVQSSSHWVLRGLDVSPEHAPAYETATLVQLESHGWRGPVHDVVVEHCRVQSVADTSGWTADDWNQLACNGFGVDGANMTVRSNLVRNVNFGISVGARDSLIERNLVENFAGDGLRGLGDYTVFQYNTVKNCYDVNANHDDGFQSWSNGDGGVGTGEVVGIVLRGNRIVNYEDPAQPHRGTLQGIGCFDGMFVDWVVENNLIVTDHWHGITLSGARDCRLVNNTVLDLNQEDPGPPWVRIGKHKDGTASTGCVVRNNLTTAVSVDEGQDVAVDHNLIIDDPAVLFVDPAAGDFHLLQDAAAVDSASPEDAPPLDIEEVPRPQGEGFDIGAYEYHTGSIEPDGGSDADAGTDAGHDAGHDAGRDAGQDAGDDAGAEDAGVDAGQDAGRDAGSGADAADAGGGDEPVDASGDPGADTGPAGSRLRGSCGCGRPGTSLLLLGLLGLACMRGSRRQHRGQVKRSTAETAPHCDPGATQTVETAVVGLVPRIVRR